MSLFLFSRRLLLVLLPPVRVTPPRLAGGAQEPVDVDVGGERREERMQGVSAAAAAGGWSPHSFNTTHTQLHTLFPVGVYFQNESLNRKACCIVELKGRSNILFFLNCVFNTFCGGNQYILKQLNSLLNAQNSYSV